VSPRKTLPAGWSALSVTGFGHRTGLVARPAGTPTRLMVSCHGGGASRHRSTVQAARMARATAAGWLVVCPDSRWVSVPGVGGTSVWAVPRAGAADVFARVGGFDEDVAFIEAIRKWAAAKYPDLEQTVLSGFSSGAGQVWSQLAARPSGWDVAVVAGAALPRAGTYRPGVGPHVFFCMGTRDEKFFGSEAKYSYEHTADVLTAGAALRRTYVEAATTNVGRVEMSGYVATGGRKVAVCTHSAAHEWPDGPGENDWSLTRSALRFCDHARGW
jgi:predicted esterase